MYAKVFVQIYDGSLCTQGPWQALVTFQQMLVLADQDGAVDMTAEAISRRTTIPIEIIQIGIAELLKPDEKSRTPAEEGRRIIPLSQGRDWGWQVVNYKHYRQLKREEDRREYHREYWHKRQAKTQQPQHTQPNQPIAEAKAEASTPAPSVLAPQGAGAATPAQEAEGKVPKTPKTRGTRLPADWVLPKVWGVWALSEYPHWTPDIVRQIGLSFADHWHAATGRGSTKADWPATWRNWCRSDIQQRKHPKAGKQQTAFAAERTAQADRIMGSYAAQARAADNQQPSFIDMEAFDAPRLTDG